MDESRLLRRYLDLFWGRPDAMGLDDGPSTPPGVPGPLRLASPTMDDWEEALAAHLDGRMGLGVYPVHQDMVRWGCVDFDEGEVESFGHALSLYAVLDALYVRAWIERSRSKGYHVWVFARSWVPAKVMRRALLGACQAAEVPTKEINPKSEHLAPEELGNFVRLPYKGWWAGARERQVVVSPGTGAPLALEAFVDQASASMTDEAVLSEVGRLWAPPVPHVPRRPYVEGDTGLEACMSPLARVIYANGPREGQDRSSWLMALAHACAESGMSGPAIVRALEIGDETHTRKFTHRKDRDKRYLEMADKAVATCLV